MGAPPTTGSYYAPPGGPDNSTMNEVPLSSPGPPMPYPTQNRAHLNRGRYVSYDAHNPPSGPPQMTPGPPSLSSVPSGERPRPPPVNGYFILI